MEQDRRAFERQPYRTTVTIEHADRTWSGFVVDCSEGGLFAISYLPAVVGDTIRLWFQRPHDSVMVVLEGEVSRRCRRQEDTGEPAGIGVQFASSLSSASACA